MFLTREESPHRRAALNGPASCPGTCPSGRLHVNGISVCCFCVRLLSLGVTFSRFFCTVVRASAGFLSRAECSIVCMWPSLFVCSSLGGRVGLSTLWCLCRCCSDREGTSLVRASFPLFWCTPGSGVAGPRGGSVFTSSRSH